MEDGNINTAQDQEDLNNGTPRTSNVHQCSDNANTLKRKLLNEAETERLKKAKK